MEYKVVPSVASIDHKSGTSDHVAQQLINQGAADGWEYIRLESVTTFVSPLN
ncbi:hypothetical protein [Sphingobacterium faecale]|uniref:DUF4177 domain-containing protein n=1 Tax=Sphingobacterium faecale TaxID=2803775 RepID=A0ABS1RCJ3_9SPHI|nr:hypothetical protein [Sphingobacterium faecale]MBL1411551.1 hypothetical protein [Sphingobacterium faecale]